MNVLRQQIEQTAKNNIKFYKKQLIIIFAICLIAISLTTLLSSIVAHADNEKQCTWQQIEDNTGQAKEHNHKFTKQLLEWSDTIFGGANIEELADIIKIKFGNDTVSLGSLGNEIDLSILNKIHKMFVNFGVMVATMFFCIGIYDEACTGNIRAERIVFKCLGFMITLALVQIADDLVYSLANTGSDLITKINDYVKTQDMIGHDSIKELIVKDTTTADLIDADKHFIKHTGKNFMDGMTAMGYFASMFLPYVFCLGCNMMIKVQALSRFFEIVLTATVSPVTVADLAKGNVGQSGAIRAFKNIIALSLSGAVMMVILILSTSIRTGLLGDSIENGTGLTSALWNSVLICVVQLGLIKKSMEITKSALGLM